MSPAPAWLILRCDRPEGALRTILSVDGGGLRGLIPATVLLYVEQSIITYLLNNRNELKEKLKVYKITACEEAISNPVACDRTFFRGELARLGGRMEEAWPAKRMRIAYLDHVWNAWQISQSKGAAGATQPFDFPFAIWLADYFDLCAGTSTGAIIATYLATRGMHSLPLLRDLACEGQMLCPGSANALVAVFKAKAHEIFPKKHFKVLRFMWSALYSAKPLEKLLYSALGDSTLEDGISDSTSLLITSFELDRTRPITFFSLAPKFDGTEEERGRRSGYAALVVATVEEERGLPRLFGGLTPGDAPHPSPPPHHSGGGRMAWGQDSHGRLVHMSDFVYTTEHSIRLREAVRASSAAPTFLPTAAVTLRGPDGKGRGVLRCIDGGVAANNPSQEALTFAIAAGAEMDKIAILSLGTGVARARTTVKDKAGGVQWMTGGNLISLLMMGNSSAVSAQVDFLMGQVAARNDGEMGGSHHLRVDKIIFDGGADPKQARMAAACDSLDLAEHMQLYETMGHELMNECNDLLHSVDPDRDVDTITNRELIEKFVADRIFRRFA